MTPFNKHQLVQTHCITKTKKTIQLINFNFKFKIFHPFSAGKIGGVRPTDGSGCPRCGYVVYEAEKMISKKNSWHKRCFNCTDCHKSLDSTNLCDGPNGEIYCRGKKLIQDFEVMCLKI